MRASTAKKTVLRKSSTPRKSWKERRNEIADSLESDIDNIAMVACSECVRNNTVCYYDREQSVSCAACLRHQRSCDGTFSLEEFRRVGDQKKEVRQKSRQKRKEIARLRRLLLEAEEEDVALQDSLAELEQKSEAMLRREMQALGVLEPFSDEQLVAWGSAEPSLPALSTDQVDWDSILDPGGSGQQGVELG